MTLALCGMPLVDIDTIYEDTYSVIRTVINDNVTDPISPVRALKWVVSMFPDMKKSSWPGYPIIIINPLDIGGMRGMNFSKNLWDHSCIITIELFDTNISRMDTLSSSTAKALRDNVSTFITAKLHNLAFTGGRSDTLMIEGKKVFYRSIIMGFDFADQS